MTALDTYPTFIGTGRNPAEIRKLTLELAGTGRSPPIAETRKQLGKDDDQFFQLTIISVPISGIRFTPRIWIGHSTAVMVTVPPLLSFIGCPKQEANVRWRQSIFSIDPLLCSVMRSIVLAGASSRQTWTVGTHSQALMKDFIDSLLKKHRVLPKVIAFSEKKEVLRALVQHWVFHAIIYAGASNPFFGQTHSLRE